MSMTSEMTADLREIIACSEGAEVALIFQGRPINGTKGDLTMAASLDRDDGGIFEDDKFTATFVLADFPATPAGKEIVTVNGSQKRILTVRMDDLNVAVALDFTSPNEE